MLDKNISTYNYIFGSLGIAPTRNCTHFLKIGFVVAGGGFYSYYIQRGNKSDKERKIVRKLSFMHTKRFNALFKRWVQFCMGAIPPLPYTFCNHCKINFFYLEDNILFWSLSSAFTSKTWNCKTKVSIFYR